MIWCIMLWKIKDELEDLADMSAADGLKVVGICSSEPNSTSYDLFTSSLLFVLN